MSRKLFRTFFILVLVSMFAASAAWAAPQASQGAVAGPDSPPREDNRSDPYTAQQQELKQEALQAQLNGKALGKTHEVARGQFVELEREGEGTLWTVLGEFADLQHNTMPEPDRAVDNTTLWIRGFQPGLLYGLCSSTRPRARTRCATFTSSNPPTATLSTAM